jgi:hypothetical protein
MMPSLPKKAGRGGRPILVKLGIAGRGARLAQASAMAAFMIESIVYFGIGSFLGALPVVGLSLPVIVNRRAARRPEARSAIRLVELGRGNAIKRLKIDLDALRDQLTPPSRIWR